jgi:hypothetical protein
MIATLAVAFFVAFASSAPAQEVKYPNTDAANAYSAEWHSAFDKCGRCAGRNIRKYGVRYSSGRVERATFDQVDRSLDQLRRITAPAPVYLETSAGPPAQDPSGVQTATTRAPSGGILAKIRGCESGGDYSTDTGNGFHGAYQFDQGTWESVGGTGNPANASPEEQDRRAAALLAQRGTAPWPVCGR